MPAVRTATGSDAPLDAAALFAIAWDALADVLGTAAVAAIMRRAAARGCAREPELLALVISREDLEYRYMLPPAWSQPDERGVAALRVLVAEVGRLLLEMTGSVLLDRLEQIPALHARGLVWRPLEAN